MWWILASKVTIDVETNRDLGNNSTKDILDKLYKEKELPALAVLDDDRGNRSEIILSIFAPQGCFLLKIVDFLKFLLNHIYTQHIPSVFCRKA